MTYVLSASRRTDIPGFYTDWFMTQINAGFFEIKNPFTRKTRRFDVSPKTIHSIVFWSKNYDVFIRSGAGRRLREMGFHLFFNFTINSGSSRLEPCLPELSRRIDQLETLARLFGPQAITWRFDPICFYRTKQNGPIESNLAHFPFIAQKASQIGIPRCVTSFFDPYAKIKRRLNFLAKTTGEYTEFIDPEPARKAAIIRQMSKDLSGLGMGLSLCCEKEIFNLVGPETQVQQHACINGRKLQALFGGTCITARDYGQRSKKGCLCTKSVDIGSYDDHPCYHNCLFCYARPYMDTAPGKKRLNNEN